MKVTATLTLCLGAASAFAPTTPVSRPATAVQVTLDGTFGTGPETGGKCPPLGNFLADASPDGLKWFQNAEIKHCRIAMVATIGYMVQKFGIYMPLYCGPPAGEPWYLSTSAGITFADVSKAAPLDAIQMVPLAGFLQIFICAGLFESVAYARQWNQNREIPGDYGYDPLGFTKRPGGWDSKELTDLRMKEIKNGRLAMYVYWCEPYCRNRRRVALTILYCHFAVIGRVAISGWVSEQLIPGSFPLPQP